MFGPYRLERLLGRGGMGEVHEAYDTVRGRNVALKLLAVHLSDDETFTARFRREARIAARLNDPHIVPIHDSGEIDGRLYLDMRLILGEDLGALLAREGKLDPDRATTIIEQVASALDTAHEDGLVHRDVKPSNILMTAGRPGRPEFVYLCDFGIARSVTPSPHSAVTATGATLGTLHYMAPERFLGVAIDHRVDIYALACMFYECLTGRRPFEGEEMVALMHGHVYRPVPLPSASEPSLPRSLDDVVRNGMAKDARNRFTTAGAFAAAARLALTVPVSYASPEIPRYPANAATLVGASGGGLAAHSADAATNVARTAASINDRPVARPPRSPIRRNYLVAGGAAATVALVAATLFALPVDGTPTRPTFPAGTTMARLADAGAITVGTKFDQVLFGQRGADGKPAGFEVEIAKIIASRMGIAENRIEFVETPSRIREDVIEQKAVDMVVATYTINDVRRTRVSFAGPYYLAGQDLMVRSDNTTIISPESLRAANARVCSVTGSSPAKRIVDSAFVDATNLVLFDVYSKCADALRNGQVDAVTTDNVILAGLADLSGGAFKLVNRTFTDEPYGVGIPRGDVAFCEFINQTLRDAAADGSYSTAWTGTVGRVIPQVPPLPAAEACS